MAGLPNVLDSALRGLLMATSQCRAAEGELHCNHAVALEEIQEVVDGAY
jgi:hypothetical protein